MEKKILFIQHLIAKFLWKILWILFSKPLNFFLDIKIENEDIIKDFIKNLKPPLLIVANHSSILDVIVLGYVFGKYKNLTPIHFAVFYKYYYYFWPIFWPLGSFPVKKGVPLEKNFKPGIEALKKKWVVGIFPEGRRHKKGRRRNPRRGVAFLILKTKVPILPIWIEGLTGMNFKKFFSRKTKVRLKIGNLIEFKENEQVNDEEKILQKIKETFLLLRIKNIS